MRPAGQRFSASRWEADYECPQSGLFLTRLSQPPSRTHWEGRQLSGSFFLARLELWSSELQVERNWQERIRLPGCSNAENLCTILSTVGGIFSGSSSGREKGFLCPWELQGILMRLESMLPFCNCWLLSILTANTQKKVKKVTILVCG